MIETQYTSKERKICVLGKRECPDKEAGHCWQFNVLSTDERTKTDGGLSFCKLREVSYFILRNISDLAHSFWSQTLVLIYQCILLDYYESLPL